MKEKRRFAALLAAAALAVNLVAVPVLATEATEQVSPLTGVIQPDPPEEDLPNPDPPPEQSSSSSSSVNNPATGESTPLFAILGLAAVAGAAMIVVKKKEQK